MVSFLESVKSDFAKIVTDDVVYFGKTIKVKLFESIDDPAIVNKSGGVVPLYCMASLDDFLGVEAGQNIKINETDYTIYNFRKSIYGTISIILVGASGK